MVNLGIIVKSVCEHGSSLFLSYVQGKGLMIPLTVNIINNINEKLGICAYSISTSFLISVVQIKNYSEQMCTRGLIIGSLTLEHL